MDRASERGLDNIVVFSMLLVLIHVSLEKVQLYVRRPVVGGTVSDRPYYLVNNIVKTLSQIVTTYIIGSHTPTGSDTTSSFLGFGKKTCLNVILTNPNQSLSWSRVRWLTWRHCSRKKIAIIFSCSFNRANNQAKSWLGACQHAFVVNFRLPEMSDGSTGMLLIRDLI